MTLSIEKRNYSSNPWRLIYNGQEVYRTELFDHPDLGKQTVQMPICANTKTECTELAFKWFEERMQAMKERIESLKERIEGLKLEVKTLRSYGNKDCIAMADDAIEQAKLLAPETPTYAINSTTDKAIGLDVDRHNNWVEKLKEEVEFEPLKDFLDQLKEPPTYAIRRSNEDQHSNE